MSSDLQPLVESFVMQNYASVFVVTAVSYDYLLNLSREVEYVWRKPWSWVSMIYVVVRYVGISWVIINGLYTGLYINDPPNVYAFNFNEELFSKGIATFLLALWEFPIFLYASDLVMILRVYALWRQSKTILYILLAIYIPQIIVTFVLLGLYDSTNISAQNTQFLDFYSCSMSFGNNVPLNIGLYDSIPRFVLAAILLVLAVAKTLKESMSMYRATKRWQPNRYMEQFASDGIIYFIVNVLLDIVTLIPGGSTALLFVISLSYVAIGIMMSRFIINMRELYYRDGRGRLQGMDSAFGMAPRHVTDSDTLAVSAMAFAGPGEGESQGMEVGDKDLGQAGLSEGIQMEALKDDAHARV